MKNLSHIAGTFLIAASGSFLNGAGLSAGEDRNVTIPKTFRDGNSRVPYVSSQAWKRWLRNTLIDETGWPSSEIIAIDWTKKGTVNKISGKLDPILCAEDDIFGYMKATKGQGKAKKTAEEDNNDDSNDGEESTEEDEDVSTKGKRQERVKSVMRASPFSASLLVSIRKFGWEGKDEGFVHLKEGTPLPYSTEFYNTHLQGVFSLNYSRLGLFSNIGDRIELDDEKKNQYLNDKKIKRVGNGIDEIYELVNATESRKERASALIRAITVLRGGAKQAAFGTPVEPQAIIFAGLTCGNPIFHHLFSDAEKGPELKIDSFKEIVSDYKQRIATPVFIGIRNAYLSNETKVRELKGEYEGVKIEVMSPLQAAEGMANSIMSA
ncbi:MAG: DevR family CRISPR-associated autoregulator [Nitrososphaerales archaeon]